VRTRSSQPSLPGAPTRAASAPGRGRHRRTPGSAAVDVVGQLGSFVTLMALLVLAATAGGLVDGVPADAGPTVTVTYER
jgi:hypothetical protein